MDNSFQNNAPTLTIRGVKLWQGYLSHELQQQMVNEIREVVGNAPLFRPTTPGGKQMSVRMTSAGVCGWVSDGNGYRYQDTHPNGCRWPDIPPSVLSVWDRLSHTNRQPDCCLINFYDDTAKMGLHQDRDEADFSYPVLSVSLGDDALFRIGNTTRGGKTQSVWLRSGDVLSMSGEARLIYHGIDRLKPNTSPLLKNGGRINLTLRVVT